MTHSVENRFIAIICGALLLFVAPLFVVFFLLSSERSAIELRNHADVVVKANSLALGKPLWDLDEQSVTQIAATIVIDPSVLKVEINDTSGQLNIAQSTVPKRTHRPLESITAPIVYRTVEGPQNVGSITVYFDKIGIFSAMNQLEVAFISIFAVAIMVVFGAAVLGHRLMIIKPLMRLTAAIEATRKLGSRQHVDWHSNDEMGRLALSFNEMQTLLEREERELKRAHRRTSDIYNQTPAMLFSIDDNDCITAVSDYWLLATGYTRSNVIGRKFTDMVDPSTRCKYETRKEGRRDESTPCEVTVKFVCADGRIMDVLIVETRTVAAARWNELSLSVMTDVTELKRSEDRNRRQALTDHLTGLMNRQGFEAALDAKIQEATAERTELACLFIDLDRFKWINDNLGHVAGDAVLCGFVQRLTPLLGPGDTAARLGGDEFAVLILGSDAEETALDLCHRITALFDEPFRAEGAEARLSASIGVSLYPRHTSSAAELLQKSDVAMYAKKRDGKNGVQIFHPSMMEQAARRVEVESNIQLGLEHDWFDSYFQPIVDLNTKSVIGFEALMRMIHPQKGILAPAEIIHIAEETGTIGYIGNRILEKSFANLSELSRVPGMADTYVAINFSPLQFEPSLPVRLASLADRYNIRPGRIVIEITEAVLMNDNPEIRRILDEVSGFGCRIALDDFGTGYSSLSYLNRFPVDIVKIDQSFTRAMTDTAPEIRAKSRTLVEGIAAISRKMECKIIAEGIETSEQWQLLDQLGIDCGQGYFISRPQPVNRLQAMLAEPLVIRVEDVG
ncbi:EAL domain-containing protein [Rhizobiaceae bacterium n13]|uniref:EAL domain-containing protein n=1 Tax=Ferirhizobium litorale TaxID=2927786 RepID=A0AAE3U257_9HYPH|nr:EAL domain-containing protein [Fererhizobium litorale]MDI7860880.1 EAL domain-containing protein [Fererhizobium litorale]MDI7921028.1 EAL domain-containing protein [Fererhizobium litorale]